MLASIASASLIGLSALSAVSAAPFSFPLSNGFPNITNPSSQLTDIEIQAHGILPNGPPPPSISNDAVNSLRLIAFNEIFEVAFFTDLILNITNNVPGYTTSGSNSFLLNALTAVQAQEELHALNANGALAHFGFDPIEACEYVFPVDNLNDAIALASKFTDVVLGTLQDVVSLFGADGDELLIRGVASVIGQEGEQNGFYRTLLDKIPSALPFLTTSTREFAFSALNQNFVVPGSCPNIGEIQLPIFQVLNVVTPTIAPQSQELTFSINVEGTIAQRYGQGDYSQLSVVYINQQSLPIVEPITGVSIQGNTVTFQAFFPFEQFEMNGLTIAAVAHSAGPFASADAVAQATIFGPGLIEIN